MTYQFEPLPVGTSIRVTHYLRIHKGLVGAVREYRDDNAIFVDFPNDGGSGVFKRSEIEVVE